MLRALAVVTVSAILLASIATAPADAGGGVGGSRGFNRGGGFQGFNPGGGFQGFNPAAVSKASIPAMPDARSCHRGFQSTGAQRADT